MTTLADRRAADIALTVGAVLGSLCLLATALAVVTGLRPVIFETGSMSPAISTGSLGLSRTVPAADVHRGDVVGVTRPDGTRVTHRVESVDGRLGDSVTLTLKGDGNTVTDARPYAVTEVDRVYTTVPGLGYVAMWLKNPYTIALEALVLLGLLAVAFAPRDGWRATSTGRRILIGTAAATVATVAVTGAVTPGRSDAALTAQAHATGSVQTGRPANAAWLRCNDTGGLLGLGSSVTMTWPNPPGTPTGLTYVLTVQGPNATPQEHTYPAATAGNPVVVNAANLGLLSWLVALLGNIVGGADRSRCRSH
ncbi:signal peptidase I [Gordonia humi]|uniref:signal peptidase I n=1 Tax=Gordonia humi TaxID=686429 RepID=UPI00360B9C0A